MILIINHHKSVQQPANTAAATCCGRCDGMMVEAEGICLDYCRQKVTKECHINFPDTSVMIHIRVDDGECQTSPKLGVTSTPKY